MERPSHIAFSNAHIARRLPLFALAAFLQVGAVALIMTGLGHRIPFIPGDLHFNPTIKQPTIDPPQPPKPTEIKPELPHAIAPIFIYDTDPGTTAIHTQPKTTVEQPSVKPQPPQPPGPSDHAAVGITATHTIPPYPTIAIRQGVEGTVLLRLTVLETGRVARAEVVTGSGNDALDRAAQAWIVAHWAYSRRWIKVRQ